VGLLIRDYFAEKKQIRDETARLRTEIEEERAETEKENARQREALEKENARQREENARQREALEKENARHREALEKTLEKFRSDILLKVVLEKAKLDPKAIEYIQQEIVEATNQTGVTAKVRCSVVTSVHVFHSVRPAMVHAYSCCHTPRSFRLGFIKAPAADQG
jgi:predicted nuclease with TOPRIM domain